MIYFNTPKDNITFCKKCKEAKKIISKVGKSTTIWRYEYAPSDKIGKMAELYKDLKPINVVDFYEKYITCKDGRTQEYLERISYDYKNKSENKTNNDRPLEDYFYDALCHIIYETYNGMEREKQISKYLCENNEKIFNIETVQNEIDSAYGIDRIINTKNGKYALQIKPISFFVSTYEQRPDTYFDRFGSIIKYYKSKQDLNITTFFAIYNEIKTDTISNYEWFINDKHGILFDINDLFEDISEIYKNIDFFSEIYNKKDKNKESNSYITLDEISKIQSAMKDLTTSIDKRYKTISLNN